MEESKATQLERVFKIYELFFSHTLEGLTNNEIAKLTGYSTVNVCRDLAALKEIGIIERTPSERWALTPKPVALIKKYNLHLQQLGERIETFDKNTSIIARR